MILSDLVAHFFQDVVYPCSSYLVSPGCHKMNVNDSQMFVLLSHRRIL